MQTLTSGLAEGATAGSFRIGALKGAPTPEIQRLLTVFAERRRNEGLRVAGVIEIPATKAGPDSETIILRDLVTGSVFPVFQDLGKSSMACSVDPGGLAAACQSVLNAIGAGTDLVVLSKFGKLEESGSGLLQAFGAAAEAGIPCVTGVAPAFAAPFLAFAGGFAQWLDASDTVLEHWWGGA